MGILIRAQGGKWQSVEKVGFKNESELQELLYGSPELLAEDGNGIVVFARECSLPGSGYTDLIGVDVQGEILIVETKLARNREIRREVIGQVLEYAAYLWQMSFEDFNQRFVAREGRSILDLLADKAPEIDREELRNRIAANLATGKFNLLIAVDEINPELDKIIAYLSGRGSGLNLEALEFETYKHGTMDLLVPHRRGQIKVEPGLGTAQTKEQMLAACKDEISRHLFRLVLDSWETSNNAIVPGTVGASFRAQIGADEKVIFWAYPDSVQAAFNVLAKAGAPSNAVTRYRERVSRIAGFNAAKVLKESQPITKWRALNEEAVCEFLAASHELIENWRNNLDVLGVAATAD